MQKFIIGLALGIAAGAVVMAYSKSARDLAAASKDFASQKLACAKEGVEEKTEEIKDKTKESEKNINIIEEKPKQPTRKPRAKKPITISDAPKT